MAINVSTTYPPGRYVDPSADYPTGSIKNSSLPTLKDGSPLLAEGPNDMQGFTDALLAQAGLTHSGSPDTALISQRLEALSLIFAGYIPVSGGGTLEVNKRYLILDDGTYTLPDVTDLNNRSTVEMVRRGVGLLTDPTPLIQVEGSNSEEVNYFDPATGVLDETDTSVQYNISAPMIFLFNATSGNWEL